MEKLEVMVEQEGFTDIAGAAAKAFDRGLEASR